MVVACLGSACLRAGGSTAPERAPSPEPVPADEAPAADETQSPSAETPRPEEPAPSTEPKEGPSVITLEDVRRHPDPRPKAEGYGLVRAVQVLEECSGLGGTHVVLEVVRSPDEAKPLTAAYHGGHGYTGFGGGLISGEPDPDQLDAGPWFIAGLAARKSKDEPGLPHTVGAGWCLDGLRVTDGVAVWLAPVANEEAGVAVLDALAADETLRIELRPPP